MKYPFHEFANLFPLLEKDDLQGLVDSIRTDGLKEKIMLFEDKILDGRNRSVACEQAGEQPVYEEFTGSRMDALNYVFLINAHRRHLTSSQRAAIGIEKAELMASIVQENQKIQKQSIPQQGQKGWQPSVPQQIADNKKPRNYERETTAQIAKNRPG